jgi:ADP-ribose pyrophosphatase
VTHSREPENPWRILSSTLVHDGSPWIRVFQDTVETGTGRVVEDFHRVEAMDFALVFARDRQGQVIMLRQWRQGPQRFALSFPGGHVEPGEDPAQAARRELIEEAGFNAEAVRPLGRFCMHSNFGLGWGNFFIAEGVSGGAGQTHDDLERADIRLISETDLETALETGEIATVHDALCARLALAASG